MSTVAPLLFGQWVISQSCVGGVFGVTVAGVPGQITSVGASILLYFMVKEPTLCHNGCGS